MYKEWFTIKLIYIDLEFSSIEFRVIIDNKAIPISILNIGTKNHFTERSIQVIKE